MLKKIYNVVKFVAFPAINVTAVTFAPIFAAMGAGVGSTVLIITDIVANAIYLGYKLFEKKTAA